MQRQREGILAARIKGKKFGRPRIDMPDEWEKIVNNWKRGDITAVEAMQKLHLNRGTFYRRIKELG